MVTLPTFDVTEVQAQRLLAAFGSVSAYKSWLRQRLIDYVIVTEQSRLAAEAPERG